MKFFNAVENGAIKGAQYGTYAAGGVFVLGTLTVAASIYYAQNYSSGPGDIRFLIGVFAGAGAMVCSTSLITAGATIGGATAGIVEFFNPEQAEPERHEM